MISPVRFDSRPLDIAARCGYLETVKALLRHGATVSDALIPNILAISNIAEVDMPAVSLDSVDTRRTDILRLRENIDGMLLALRRALLKQRYDEDRPLTPRLTELLQSQHFSLKDWNSVNAHLCVASVADIPILPIEEVVCILSRARVSEHQLASAVRLWNRHAPSAGQ